MTLTPQHLQVLGHTLGLNAARVVGSGHRNHFVAAPGHDDFPACQELCRAGLMVDYGGDHLSGGSHCFRVTEAGREAFAAARRQAA
jgi:hypothetical protein